MKVNGMRKTMAVGLAALIAMYFLGGMSARHEIFPWPRLSALRTMVGGEKAAAPSHYAFDDKERLIGNESKTRSHDGRKAVTSILCWSIP
ncbi:hypothetical protein ACVIEM_005751 [Rhizobium leguminosarum]